MSDDSEGIIAALQELESNVVSALQEVEQSVKDVEEAVRGKWSTLQGIGIIIVLGVIFWWIDDAWHAKWRYAWTYGVSSDKVQIEDRPHDCAFLAAPLGEKYCHYERIVSTVRWATSTQGLPIVSYDEGKTWSIFTPPTGEMIPTSSTIESVDVGWNKKDD